MTDSKDPNNPNPTPKFAFSKYSRPSSASQPKPNTIARQPFRSPQKDDDIRISCRATNPLSIRDDVSKVFQDPRQAKATTATRLFRNDELFAATKNVTAEFLRAGNRGKFSMWSSGCSSGEEVYSMAMIALNEFTRAKARPFFEAFGTDINDQRIAEARMGRYGRPGKDSFSQNYWRLLSLYANIDSAAVQMGDELRSICRFMKFDMRNKPKKHTFNFIVCNHVLQYYDTPGQRHIITNLVAVLKPGGKMYLEGVTDHKLSELDVHKIPNSPNMYEVVKK